MSRYVNDPLADWQAASKQHFDLVTDPEGHWRKLVDLAILANERRQVRSDELSEMLELADAARLWGLVEWEEADGAGLFLEHIVDPEMFLFSQKGIGELWQDAGVGGILRRGKFGEWLIMVKHHGASLQRALDAKP